MEVRIFHIGSGSYNRHTRAFIVRPTDTPVIIDGDATLDELLTLIKSLKSAELPPVAVSIAFIMLNCENIHALVREVRQYLLSIEIETGGTVPFDFTGFTTVYFASEIVPTSVFFANYTEEISNQIFYDEFVSVIGARSPAHAAVFTTETIIAKLEKTPANYVIGLLVPPEDYSRVVGELMLDRRINVGHVRFDYVCR